MFKFHCEPNSCFHHHSAKMYKRYMKISSSNELRKKTFLTLFYSLKLQHKWLEHQEENTNSIQMKFVLYWTIFPHFQALRHVIYGTVSALRNFAKNCDFFTFHVVLRAFLKFTLYLSHNLYFPFTLRCSKK